jgi:hypothetical protein
MSLPVVVMARRERSNQAGWNADLSRIIGE